MGRKDSSKTRVQPVFQGLLRQDPIGQTWLESLISSGSLSPKLLPVFSCIKSYQFEFAVSPPILFLKWLIHNPDKLKYPKKGYWQEMSEETRHKRILLLANDESIQSEAEMLLGKYPKKSGW